MTLRLTEIRSSIRHPKTQTASDKGFDSARACFSRPPGRVIVPAMEPKTHLAADPHLCGIPEELGEGSARVVVETTDTMVVDAEGLVHGGFVFGVADYAAMLAVNEANVVLGAAQTRFLKPVRLGDRLIARAETVESHGRKHEVRVEATVNADKVFEGTFTCFVLEQHVLEGVGSK